MSDLLTIILAAGKGTRMKSEKNKVLHKVSGKEMINHVIDSVTNISSDIVCIVGHQADEVKKAVNNNNVNFRLQSKQLGTAHAVKQAEEDIKKHDGNVLILYADIPLIQENTLKEMNKYHLEKSGALTILTAVLKNPTGYGRIIRDKQNEITNIIEEDDANIKQKKIDEINSGIMCVDSKILDDALNNIDNNNAQNEYYLTDIVDYIKDKDKKILPFTIKDDKEIIGVNDRKGLSEAEKVLRSRINNKHMENGVTIIDPETTYIDEEVEIGSDTIIYPFTYIEGNTVIGKNNIIRPNNNIIDCVIGDNNSIKNNNVIKNSNINNNCSIGPFAHIRPDCNIKDNVKIGDYVELKKASVNKGTKIPHLAYVGDAHLGKDTNIGAGTIFANYDGTNKNKTIVGNSVFIGSNSTLVAPLQIKDRARTGAGAVVTKDVEEDTTVIGVPAREYMKKNNEAE